MSLKTKDKNVHLESWTAIFFSLQNLLTSLAKQKRLGKKLDVIE